MLPESFYCVRLGNACIRLAELTSVEVRVLVPYIHQMIIILKFLALQLLLGGKEVAGRGRMRGAGGRADIARFEAILG